MTDLDTLIEDTLHYRPMVRHGCFTGNLSAPKLMQGDGEVFHAIKRRLEGEDLSSVMELPGLADAVSCLFVLGNRYESGALCALLKAWPAELLERLLAQGGLVMRVQKEPLAEDVRASVLELREHPDAEVRRWASQFKV